MLIFWEKNLLFDPQHGRLVALLQTKNKLPYHVGENFSRAVNTPGI